MTKDVFVKIEGLQTDTEEASVEISMPGIYHYRDGKHFIQYEEKTKIGEIISKNMIKVAPESAELSKKGRVNSHMVFDLNEITETQYPTPYGNLLLNIKTEEISIMENTEVIEITLLYTLSANEEHLFDNRLIIRITPKK